MEKWLIYVVHLMSFQYKLNILVKHFKKILDIEENIKQLMMKWNYYI